MDIDRIKFLLKGWIEQKLTDAELQELTVILTDDANRDTLLSAGEEIFDTGQELPAFREDLLPYLEKALAIDRQEEANRNKNSERTVHYLDFSKKTFFRYAAAILILIGVGAYFYYKPASENNIADTVIPAPVQEDILPGSNMAILTLSNGEKLELNSTMQQTISDGKLAINNKNGTLIYGKSDVVGYNSISTPRGGQYKLALPDGTKVWLNAASSITYPTSFPGNSRVVTITGEAYFDVIHNPTKPFIVKTYKDEITVLGTSFNVNSYTDEPGVKTSLLEGSVHISNVTLKPGDAYMNGQITATNIGQDLAWKNGVFDFHHVKLVDAMRQIGRWYDVDVRYEGKDINVVLGGEIGRNLTLKQVLNGLEDKDLHFDLKGRTVIVSQ